MMNNNSMLEELNQEHREAIEFVDRMLELIDNEGQAGLDAALKQIQIYCETELESHLQHEEMTIFSPLFREYQAHMDLTRRLLQEHGNMRALARSLNADTPAKELKEFLTLLKDHSVAEEQVLLPAVAELFTETQMIAIRDFDPMRK